MNTLSSIDKKRRDKEYLAILQEINDEELEEILTTVEKETSEYLEQVLPPKTEFNISICVSKKSEGFDFSIEVSIRGRMELRESYSRFAQDAVNYAKKKLIDLIERKKLHV